MVFNSYGERSLLFMNRTNPLGLQPSLAGSSHQMVSSVLHLRECGKLGWLSLKSLNGAIFLVVSLNGWMVTCLSFQWADWSSTIHAVDASDWGCGVTTGEFDPIEVRELGMSAGVLVILSSAIRGVLNLPISSRVMIRLIKVLCARKKVSLVSQDLFSRICLSRQSIVNGGLLEGSNGDVPKVCLSWKLELPFMLWNTLLGVLEILVASIFYFLTVWRQFRGLARVVHKLGVSVVWFKKSQRWLFAQGFQCMWDGFRLSGILQIPRFNSSKSFLRTWCCIEWFRSRPRLQMELRGQAPRLPGQWSPALWRQMPNRDQTLEGVHTGDLSKTLEGLQPMVSSSGFQVVNSGAGRSSIGPLHGGMLPGWRGKVHHCCSDILQAGMQVTGVKKSFLC